MPGHSLGCRGMRLIFLYGQPASGKLTVAKELSARTGWPVFHNHLVVDAVSAVFPFGSAEFVALRERFWLDVLGAAARAGRSLIFTFAPEPTVSPSFAARARALVEEMGGSVVFVALTVSPQAQETRLAEPGRSAFGKLRSIELLQRLRSEFDACMSRMPPASTVIDTDRMTAAEAAAVIAGGIPA